MSLSEGANRPAICMILRTSVWRNPRVAKQARSLVNAGWRVDIVSVGAVGEDRRMETHPDGYRILRASPGWRARWRAWRQARAGGKSGERGPSSAGSVPRAASGSYRPGPFRRVLLLVSRCLILARMLPLVYRSAPQVVLAHNVGALPAAWLGARLRGARLAYDAHEVNLDREGYYQDLKTVIRWVEGCLMPRCDLTMTTTALRARHFSRVYKLARSPRVFENRPPMRAIGERVDIRQRLAIPQNLVIGLYQGGLQEGRGLHNMVRATARVPGMALVMLGDGPQAASLQALARELEVDQRVYLPGAIPLSELQGWTCGADFGLQLLRNNCFNHYSTDSNKLFEYGLAGLPVIASDFPEIRRIVQRHAYGLLVDPHVVDDIVRALRRLVREPDLRQSLAARAETAGRDLSWDAVEDEYCQTMEALR